MTTTLYPETMVCDSIVIILFSESKQNTSYKRGFRLGLQWEVEKNLCKSLGLVKKSILLWMLKWMVSEQVSLSVPLQQQEHLSSKPIWIKHWNGCTMV